MIIPIISAGCSVPLMMTLRVSGRIIEAGIIDKIVRVFFICSVQAVKNMKITYLQKSENAIESYKIENANGAYAVIITYLKCEMNIPEDMKKIPVHALYFP